MMTSLLSCRNMWPKIIVVLICKVSVICLSGKSHVACEFAHRLANLDVDAAQFRRVPRYGLVVWLAWGDDEPSHTRALFALADALGVSKDGVTAEELRAAVRRVLLRKDPPAHITANATAPGGSAPAARTNAIGSGANSNSATASGAATWRWLLVIDNVVTPDALFELLDLTSDDTWPGDVIVTARSVLTWPRQAKELSSFAAVDVGSYRRLDSTALLRVLLNENPGFFPSSSDENPGFISFRQVGQSEVGMSLFASGYTLCVLYG